MAHLLLLDSVDLGKIQQGLKVEDDDDENGQQLGVMSPMEGRRIADDRGLDLVEVAPNARPPVCRIMDYGRFRYEQKKSQKNIILTISIQRI